MKRGNRNCPGSRGILKDRKRLAVPGFPHLVYPATLLIVLLVALFGCAVSPVQEPAEAEGPVFYPPLPNPPRLQFLTSISGVGKVASDESAFARYVLGSEEEPRFRLIKPYGVSLHEGKLYTVDTRGEGYAVFDLVSRDYRPVRGMQKPINITIDADGNRWIADTGLNQVLVYDRDDKRMRAYGTSGQFKPGDVALVDDKVLVTDLAHHRVDVLDRETGEVVLAIGAVGADEGDLMFPTNLAVGSDGRVYVSDTGNFRISVFTPEGRYLGKVGEIGDTTGKFARPKGIALDREDRLYVVDSAFQNVQVFNPDGQLLTFFGGAGVGPGQLYLPADISIDYDNVEFFRQYAAEGFDLEYLVLVSNQFGPHKINVYGFGTMKDMDYP
jgi:sugar lactone lactonase YvrE